MTGTRVSGMGMRGLGVILFIIISAGCRHPHPTSTEVLPSETTVQFINGHTQVHTCNAFTRVNLSGTIDVELHTGDLNPRVILHGDSRDLRYVQVTVAQGFLTINVGKGFPHFGPIKAEIWTSHLSGINYHGTGTVIGNRLTSNGLDVFINNRGKTYLQGNLVVRNIEISGPGVTQIGSINSKNLRVDLKGSGRLQLVGVSNITSVTMSGTTWMSLYWVKSHRLIVHQKDQSFLQLAGIADRLDAELWGKAHFNGRYLRVKRLFLKTHNQSVADITTTLRQHTLATDTSNIYFYHIPEMKADFMANNGAVLDMRDLSPPFLQEYDRYNKT